MRFKQSFEGSVTDGGGAGFFLAADFFFYKRRVNAEIGKENYERIKIAKYIPEVDMSCGLELVEFAEE